jgi:hypothetical protein
MGPYGYEEIDIQTIQQSFMENQINQHHYDQSTLQKYS